MGSTSGCIRDRIGIFIGFMTSASLQDTLYGGSSDNDISVEKADWEVGGLDVYCSCRDALWGIRRT